MPESMQDLFSPEKKLFLLDGMALIYRAHFALIRSPRFTSGGQCTSAVFGLFNAIMDILAKENPTHLACAFDTSEPTQRHLEYAEYKAQRDEMPEDLASQVPLVDRLLDALNIPVFRLPGYEADDIIGTIATQASEREFETWMVTPDKDYHQLVTDRIHVYKPGRKGSEPEILGVAEVREQWQVERVDQVIDVLGLMGDTSDNVPGVPGIGPKTAMKLISQFGSVEGVIENSAKLKGKQRERVEENSEQALLSTRLVTIQLDVPLQVDWDSL
ncbi:MAG: 5'-3' exonuclease H3TH domain-containing protein, partial [Planctomycetota bacterium]